MYTVTLADGFGSEEIVISYEVTGTATAGLDYTAPNGKVTIGKQTGIMESFDIQTTADEVDEVGETLVVTLTGATTAAGKVAIGSPHQVTTMIVSGDTKVVTVEDNAVTVEDNAENEGEMITFEVVLPGFQPVPDDGSVVTIAYATVDGDATAGVDYTAESGTLTLTVAASATMGSITVETRPDMLSEDDETFTLTLRLVDDPGGVALGNSAVTGTINDNDDLTVTIDEQQDTVVEGSAATFLVKLSSTSGVAGSTAVTVDYTLGGAADEDDFEEDASGTLTFPAGESVATITVTTVPDDLLEGDEVLTATLTPNSATTAAGTVMVLRDDNSAMTTIGDTGRRVTVSVADTTVDEGEDAVFTVSLSGKVSVDVMMDYETTADGTATPDTDFTAVSPAELTIEAGSETAKITVEVLEDNLAEPDEAFAVMLSSVSAAAVSAGLTIRVDTVSAGLTIRVDTAKATISDGNPLTASLAGPDTVPEGSPAIYTVTLDGGVGTEPVVVDYTVGGTATAGVDYTDEANGKLTFALNNNDVTEETATITIQTTAVSGEEAGETLLLTLTGADTEAGTADVGTPSSVTTTMTPKETVTVSLSANQRQVPEDTAATFEVELTGPVNNPAVVVDYTVSGQATADDYTAAPASGQLSFDADADADERTMTITVTPRDDDLEEADETVLVTLSLSGQPANVSIGRSTATTKITDGDTLTASVAANEESVVEGAEATFTVTLGGLTANEQVMSTADVVVAYKVNGDVTTDDYTVSSDRLTIPMGTATGVITVATVNDNLSETAEDLMVELTKATTEAGDVGFGAEPATTTILASDGEILVSVRDAGTVDEGEDAKFLVELSGTVSEDLIVSFTTDDDTATTEDTDYTDNDSSLTIEKGERTQTITVATRTDTSAENNETFKVKLKETEPASAGVNIEFSEATATIRDDDPLTVNLSGPKTVVQPTNSAPVEYTVELTDGTGSQEVVVTYQEGDNQPDTVTIRPPSIGYPGTSNTFTITIDNTRKVDENVEVTLQRVTTAAGRVRLGTSRATTRIADRDTVTVSIAVSGVDEGEPATFMVEPTGTVTRVVDGVTEDVPIVVSYTTVTGSATGADFKAKSGRLTFTSDLEQLVKLVKVETEEDSRAEENETFSMRLTLVSPRGSVELGTDSVELGTDQATVTIDDDDDLLATVASIQTMVLEGSDATFEVSLTRTETDRGSGSGSRPVVVSYRVAPAPEPTATAADYNSPSGKLTISAGQSSGMIAIQTKADDVLELAGETLALQITGVNTAAGMVTWPGDPNPSVVSPATTTRIRDADGTVVVSVADATPVVEGQAATFTVALSGKVSQPVVVEPTVAPQNSGDFTSLLQNLTIAAGETTGIVTVQTTDDADTTAGRQAEADEKFTLTIALPLTKPAGVELGTATATGTIRDDDPLRVNLSGPRAVAATEDAEFTVVLAGGTGSVAVEVGYTCVAGGAEVDCTATGDAIGTGDMMISAGALTGTITVEASQYDVDDRTLEVTLTDVDTVGTVTRGTSRVSTPIVETTISVDDETETEGDTLTFSVKPLKPVYAVVRYNTESGSARSSMDYTPVSGTLTFGSIQGTGTSTTTTTDSTPQDVPPVITLRDTPDNLNEGPETLTLRLTLVGRPPGVQIATPTVTGTISDHSEDELKASVAAAQDTVPEGSTARFVVTLTGATSTAPVVIKYQLSGDATAEDGDFTAPSGKLTIPAGSASGTIAIQILDDGKLDRGEELEVTLTMGGATSAGSVMRSASNSDSTTIGDASDGVTVSVRDTTADEGEDAVFTVELSGKVSEDVMVEYSTAVGTDSLRGASADDFTGVLSETLTIEAGETIETIPVATLPDMFAEESETFTLTLDVFELPKPDGVDFGDKTATGTITDDALTASVTGQSTVAEDDGSAEYTVTLTGFSEEADVIVNFSTEGSTATAGQDYSPAGGTLTIAAGDTSGTFTIQIQDDSDVDLREKIVVTLTAAETSDGDEVRTEGSVTTTIVDNDGPVEVSVEADRLVVAEGQQATFTVTMDGTVADEDVTLQYGTDGSAVAGVDYTAPVDATVVIFAGEMTATISVDTLSDGQDEPTDDTFVVSLVQGQALPEGVVINTDAPPATVTITDHALMASVTGPETVAEGDSAVFTVELTPDDNRSGVEVRYVMAGEAAAPGDYAAPSGMLTIPVGQNEGTITITTEEDDVLDRGETLTVRLTDDTRVLGTGLVVVGSPVEATVTILDESLVTWSVEDITVEEGDAATFTVTLDAPVQGGVTLEYETMDGTATAGDDYTAVSSDRVTVRGSRDNLTATFTVDTVDDRDGESTEDFTVTLTLLDAPAGVEPERGMATATITDDDIALQPLPPVEITEGEVKIITLMLERALSDPVTLRYTTVAGTATETADYSIVGPDGAPLPLEGIFTIPPETQTQPVAVLAVDDSLAEADETFTVELWTVPASGQPTKLGTATVTIKDNDELSASVTAPETVAEGEAARFTVSLGGGTGSAAVEVSYSLGGTAKAPADYTAPSPTMVMIQAGQQTATITIQTKTDKVLEPDETLVVTLTEATTTAGRARVGSPRSATTRIEDPVFHSINRVNQALLPGVTRASAAGALEAVSARMAQAAQGDPPAGAADLAGLTGLYRALQANERALQDGSYDLAQVLGGSSFLVPLSSHDPAAGSGVGVAVWGGGDFRAIDGGDADADDVDWDGSVWSARLGADLRFVDSLLTGLAVSWTSGGLDYVDQLAPTEREGTYASWLISAYPYVGWTTPGFGLWATGGFGWGGVSIDDADEDIEPQEADLTQWSLGAGASVTVLSTESFIAGGTTALKLKAEGFLAGATVAENEDKTIAELSVGVNQARAAIEASHAQHFAGGGSLKPSLEIGGRFDGGDGETGAGLEVGGGLTYADPGSGLTVAAGGRGLLIHGGNYGEWGLSGLIQLDPNAAGYGLMMSVRPTWGVTVSGVNGLWEHGTFDLLAGGQPGGSVEAEIGYGLPAFGTVGVLTPFAGASLTDAGAHSLSLGGRLELGPAFGLILEAERSDSANPDTEPVYDVTLEGSFRW